MSPEDRKQLIEDITTALTVTTPEAHLTADEAQWVKLAIKREAQSYELRRAIIEKSLGSLAWSAIVGIGYVFYAWATQHGYKP